MKSFSIGSDGDVSMIDNQIIMVEGSELLRETVERVLGTNKGEWFLGENEGVNMDNIITKTPDFDTIRNEVQEALEQVNETFVISEFEYSFDRNKRTLSITFTAYTDNGEMITETYTI